MGRGGQSSGGAVSKDPVLVGGRPLAWLRLIWPSAADPFAGPGLPEADRCDFMPRVAEVFGLLQELDASGTQLAPLCRGHLLCPMPGRVASTCFPGRVRVSMVSGQCRAGVGRPGLDQGHAAAAIARTDRSTSASVVRQLDTEMRSLPGAVISAIRRGQQLLRVVIGHLG